MGGLISSEASQQIKNFPSAAWLWQAVGNSLATLSRCMVDGLVGEIGSEASQQITKFLSAVRLWGGSGKRPDDASAML